MINSYDITTLIFFALILIFSVYSCLTSQIKDNNNKMAAPVHYYSAPSYHIASPIASRYASPTTEIDLYAPLPERYK